MGLSPFRKSVVEALELDESTVSRACCVPMGRSHRCPKSTALSGAMTQMPYLLKAYSMWLTHFLQKNTWKDVPSSLGSHLVSQEDGHPGAPRTRGVQPPGCPPEPLRVPEKLRKLHSDGFRPRVEHVELFANCMGWRMVHEPLPVVFVFLETSIKPQYTYLSVSYVE